MNIRKITVDDAEDYIDLLMQLDAESDFLLYQKEERKKDIHQMRKLLEKIIKSDKSVIFLAVSPENKLVGQVCGLMRDIHKVSHVMTISIGTLMAHQGGVGRVLMQHLIRHAKEKNIMRIEATVLQHNSKCLHLLDQFGFEKEGIKRRSIQLGKHFFNEYLLGWLYERS